MLQGHKLCSECYEKFGRYTAACESNQNVKDMTLDIKGSLENDFEGKVLIVREVVTVRSFITLPSAIL